MTVGTDHGEIRFEALTAIRQSLGLLHAIGIRALDAAPELAGESSSSDMAADSVPVCESVSDIRSDFLDCDRCGLRSRMPVPVFGEGDESARLVFITAWPMDAEKGRPLSGPADELFAKMVVAMGLDRASIYVIPLLKCMPASGLISPVEAVVFCRTFLDRQLAAISPDCICIFGVFAASVLLEINEPFEALRGHFYEVNQIPAMATWDPETLLTEPARKRDAWQDLQAIMKFMKLPIPGKGGE